MRFARTARCYALWLSAVPVLARSDGGAGSGILIGTVIDALSRQPVGDVVITATSPALMGEQVVVTDAAGRYRLPRRPPGLYTLRFEKEQYDPLVRADILLPVSRTVHVDIELPPGSIGEVYDFHCGRESTIDVSSSGTSLYVDHEFIKRIAVR
ncbi:carboxypeptidase-like regulatory domain-containing protein [Myxococcus sp. K15C18031901]|uniref:carboxypeptidase-like regulatory domain-containing protein n=1 Tax=Myxococcus dinghuensis TaxID=2906761 RepID=UPI0020A7518F|nr:carboxypeptidase-like regulatory domain-containing protein [Myxococcus dinghuensis]MCP3103040.1 carboxypeptidase-like regulatory domain-containing protein [Myxococcus dinghuensis]